MPKQKTRKATEKGRTDKTTIDHEKMRQRLAELETGSRKGGTAASRRQPATSREQRDRRPGPKTDERQAARPPRRAARGAAGARRRQ